MAEITLGGTVVSDDSPPFVIAEIGNNHQGNQTLAIRMIEAAAEAGANAVKFQRRDVDTLYTRAYLDRPYTGNNSYGPTYGKHRDALELSDIAWTRMEKRAQDLGVEFIITPFDLVSRAFLSRTLQNPPIFKIASALINHHELLEACVEYSDSAVIVSTGGARPDEILQATRIVPPGRLCLLHATCAYPTPDKDVYLGQILELKARYPDAVVGYSNHNAHGPLVPAVSAVIGAKVIEVHFTLDRSWKGTDHAMSLEPNGLEKLTSYLKRLHQACRAGKPARLPTERAALQKMGTSLYANRAIERGHVLTLEDIAIKSPAVDEGLPPSCRRNLVGHRAVRSMRMHEYYPAAEYPSVPSGHSPARVG